MLIILNSYFFYFTFKWIFENTSNSYLFSFLYVSTVFLWKQNNLAWIAFFSFESDKSVTLLNPNVWSVNMGQYFLEFEIKFNEIIILFYCYLPLPSSADRLWWRQKKSHYVIIGRYVCYEFYFNSIFFRSIFEFYQKLKKKFLTTLCIL